VPNKGVLTVCYKHGVAFDEAYYLDKHAAIIQRVWGPMGLERTEARKIAAAADGSTPPYQVIWSGYFASLEALQAVLQNPASGEVVGDVPNYYQEAPDIFVGEVLA
jgi:uncharacterized protein (TIGR02118 family)